MPSSSSPGKNQPTNGATIPIPPKKRRSCHDPNMKSQYEMQVELLKTEKELAIFKGLVQYICSLVTIYHSDVANWCNKFVDAEKWRSTHISEDPHDILSKIARES